MSTPLPPWELMGTERGPAAELLERSASLLEQTGRDGLARLRWYVATDAAIVLGKGQRHAKPVTGFGQTQRPSGGGAVLMDDELLSLDILIPAGHPWMGSDDAGWLGDMTKVFDPVGRAWASALAALGVADVGVHSGPATATRLGDPETRPLAEVCYASLGRSEVTANGRKIVGLSQRHRKQGALIQCGIHHVWNPAPLIEALDVGEAADLIANAAIGIDDALDRPVSDASIIRAVNQQLGAAA